MFTKRNLLALGLLLVSSIASQNVVLAGGRGSSGGHMGGSHMSGGHSMSMGSHGFSHHGNSMASHDHWKSDRNWNGFGRGYSSNWGFGKFGRYGYGYNSYGCGYSPFNWGFGSYGCNYRFGCSSYGYLPSYFNTCAYQPFTVAACNVVPVCATTVCAPTVTETVTTTTTTTPVVTVTPVVTTTPVVTSTTCVTGTTSQCVVPPAP